MIDQLIQLGDDGVPQDDAFRVAEAGDVGVDGVGVDALVDLEHPSALDAGALRRRQDLRLELLVLHRAEVVEEGVDPDG